MSELPKLQATQVLNAIREGVELPRITADELIAAIRGGVGDAVWRMITSGTDMPCADFYETMRIAAEAAFSKASVQRRAG